ncbi:unnamed protein product [Effrenium voratum]|uniref:glycerol kinase n=1 Tax=Effrenium voratum TaxID=2562239 RepID=A0AA36MG71_9DINO|nr:unnamed protein product [Effrenium voratum]
MIPDKFPDRLINVGIAEQNMVGVGAGLANGGKTPFVCGASPFLTGRALEQIKADVAYSEANVKLVGISAGMAYGELGATHHSIEDFAWIRALPNVPVIAPADRIETAAAVKWANRLREGGDVTLIANGVLAHRALNAAQLLADHGTTNSKAILIDENGSIIASGSAPVPIEHPKPGWVQQDANAIWQATQQAVASCLNKAPDAEVTALGISNQRESILAWDKRTGEPIGPVITWQCRRTAEECDTLKADGHEADVITRTGLPLDPLFPPPRRPGCYGIIRALHVTDSSNAARTQLYNLAEARWDPALCDLFGIDQDMLPAVHDSSHVFGKTQGAEVIPDGIPIASAIGDSHAALFGHGAFAIGDGKITFGTGSSVMTTVSEFLAPPQGITTTIAWSINKVPTFAFEGNILVSASILPWTAELLGLKSVDELLDLAATVSDTKEVALVPAHVGLGSPHWDSHARGLISGLSFAAGREHVALAAVQSMAFQVCDVLAIMEDTSSNIGHLYVDGGPSGNPFLMQIVADLTKRPVLPGTDTELSALGAAYLAGLATGFWPDFDAISKLPRHKAEIPPRMPPGDRDALIAMWRNAIARSTLRV